jgi:hypothetical protein
MRDLRLWWSDARGIPHVRSNIPTSDAAVTDRILYAMQLKVGLGDDRLINLRNAPFLLVFHTSWQLVDESSN